MILKSKANGNIKIDKLADIRCGKKRKQNLMRYKHIIFQYNHHHRTPSKLTTEGYESRLFKKKIKKNCREIYTSLDCNAVGYRHEWK